MCLRARLRRPQFLYDTMSEIRKKSEQLAECGGSNEKRVIRSEGYHIRKWTFRQLILCEQDGST